MWQRRSLRFWLMSPYVPKADGIGSFASLCKILSVENTVWRGRWELWVRDEGEVELTEHSWHMALWCTGAVAEGGMWWKCVCEGERDGVGERSCILPQSLLLQIDSLQLGRRRDTAIMHILQSHYVNRFERLLFYYWSTSVSGRSLLFGCVC